MTGERLNKRGNRTGMHWAEKRARKNAGLKPVDAESNSETVRAPIAGESDAGHGSFGAGDNIAEPNHGVDFASIDPATIPDAGASDEDIGVIGGQIGDTQPDTVTAVKPVSEVSVRMAVEAVSGIAAQIPPDKQALNASEKTLWGGIWEQTFQALGISALPLWLSWTIGISTTFVPRLVSLYLARSGGGGGGNEGIRGGSDNGRPVAESASGANNKSRQKTTLDSVISMFEGFANDG